MTLEELVKARNTLLDEHHAKLQELDSQIKDAQIPDLRSEDIERLERIPLHQLMPGEYESLKVLLAWVKKNYAP